MGYSRTYVGNLVPVASDVAEVLGHVGEAPLEDLGVERGVHRLLETVLERACQ